MKKMIMVGFLLFITGCTMSSFYMKGVKLADVKISTNTRVAVIPENWYWLGVSNFLPRALITEFIDLGFTVIERSQLEKLFKEIKYDYAGVTKKEDRDDNIGVDLGVLDRKSIKEIGQMLGVDALLITYIVPNLRNEITEATFRLVDVESARVLLSITFINSNTTKAPTAAIIEAVAKCMKSFISGENRVMLKIELGKVTIAEPKYSDLKIKVINKLKKPIERVKIKVVKGGEDLAVAYTDEKGYIEFKDLKYDLYEVVLWKKGYKLKKQIIEINKVYRTSIKIVMEVKRN